MAYYGISEKQIGKFPCKIDGCYVAGGAPLSVITKQPINDFDIYPKSLDGLYNAIKYIKDLNGVLIGVTKRALTFRAHSEEETYQIMTFDIFDDLKKVFNYFDFSVVMVAFDCDEKKYKIGNRFFIDTAARQLHINPNTRYPLNTLMRVRKYQEKGYSINKGELIKLGLMLSKHNFTSWEELEDAIGGTYGKAISLSQKDKRVPFDIETAYDVLENFDIDAAAHEYEKAVNITIDNVIDLIEKHQQRDDKELTAGNHTYKVDSKGFLKNFDNRHIPNDGKDIVEYLGEFGKSIDLNFAKEKFEGSEVLVYKVLQKQLDSDVLLPPVRQTNNNEITYVRGMKTTWDKYPYLFAFINKDSAINRHLECHNTGIYMAKVDVNDIHTWNGSAEVQVASMTIVKEVTEELMKYHKEKNIFKFT